ncbi:flagellar motor switch phosphatase FliY, partial [archaeon]
MEVLLAVLEAKLNSVPDLQDIQAPKPAAPAASAPASQPASAA